MNGGNMPVSSWNYKRISAPVQNRITYSQMQVSAIARRCTRICWFQSDSKQWSLNPPKSAFCCCLEVGMYLVKTRVNVSGFYHPFKVAITTMYRVSYMYVLELDICKSPCSNFIPRQNCFLYLRNPWNLHPKPNIKTWNQLFKIMGYSLFLRGLGLGIRAQDQPQPYSSFRVQ